MSLLLLLLLLLLWRRRVARKVPLVVECLVWPCCVQFPKTVRQCARADATEVKHFKVVDELARRQRVR
jgi:hypothetical protein